MSKLVTLLILSLVIISGYITNCFFVLDGKVSTADPNQLLLIGQINGGLQGMAMVIVSYFFGSTKGSEDKNDLVSDAISKMPTATTQPTKEN